MTIEEKKDFCSKVFIKWFFQEKNMVDMKQHDEDIMELFISKMLLKKFDVFDIDIVLPDALLLILDICVDGNPGKAQIILKDLLNNIKKRKGPIKPGYVIQHKDFAICFANDFPITDIETINDKYSVLWDKQKRKTNHPLGLDNLCDTPEWWKEVME